MSWTRIRHKLENEYLADSLKGHIRYFATSYSKCPDHEGRAAILLDGEEIIEGSYWEQWSNAHLLPQDKLSEGWHPYMDMDDTAVEYGMFDQQCLYNAFHEFDNQSIEKSMASDNMLVRIFAVLDRRTGKRTLMKLLGNIDSEPEVFRRFLEIRARAEGIIK